ncbi:MAG TPA: hypothetical protein VIJ07_25230 [Dermatophilaceae bacterium]
MSSLSTALTTSFRTTPGMIRTRAASDRANSAQAMALEAIRRISSEVPEILVDTIISPGQPWQAAQAGAQLVSRHPPNIVGRQP